MLLGEFNIGDVLTFTVNTHDPNTASAKDADSLPEYRIYVGDDENPIAAGEMTRFDDDNTVGFYVKSVVLSLANNYVEDASYEIRIAATVTGSIDGIPVTGTTIYTFSIAAINPSVDTDTSNNVGELSEEMLITAAGQSSEMENDSQRVKRRTIDELIKLDKHLASKKAVSRGAFGAIDVVQMIPPSGAGY